MKSPVVSTRRWSRLHQGASMARHNNTDAMCMYMHMYIYMHMYHNSTDATPVSKTYLQYANASRPALPCKQASFAT